MKSVQITNLGWETGRGVNQGYAWVDGGVLSEEIVFAC